MTAPLTPPDCDLRDFPSMLLDVARLRDSTLASNETPEACWAAVLLWAASWHQVPAASLPDDDKWIATTAGYAIRGKIDRAWVKVRDGALRKFVKCDDGRLYHPVVAEKALECWLSKLAARLSSGAGNAKRHKISFDTKPIEEQIAASRALLSALNPHSRALSRRKHGAPSAESQETPDGNPDGSPTGSQEKDKGTEGSSSEAIASAAAGAPASVDNPGPPAPPRPPADPPPPDPTPSRKRLAWNACGQWLVAGGVADTTARELMGAILRDYPDVGLDALEAAAKAKDTGEVRAYLVATAKKLREQRSGNKHPTPSAAETAELLRRQSEPLSAEAQAAADAARQRAVAAHGSAATKTATEDAT